MAGARLFAGAADAPRARRATDVLAVVLGSIGLGFMSLAESPLPAIFRPVNRVIVALPDLLTGLWQVAVGLLVWWGLGLLAAALLRGRLSVARDLALSAALAGVLSYLVAQAVHAGWPPGIAVVAAVRPWRRAVFGLAGRFAREAGAAIASLRSSRKLAMLFGGNVASEVLFALALGAFARALGTPVGLGELLVINISVGLLAGIIPIPGGVGVVEGGLAFGLVNAGMTEEAALAAVLLYRISVFYLPPLWGYFAFRWLQTNGHL